MNKEIIDGKMLKRMLAAASQNLHEHKDVINALNVFPVPDGDTGTNMALTMDAALREAGKTGTERLDKLMEMAANGSLMGARGNSGVILSQLFRGFAKDIAGKEQLTTMDLAFAMKRASDTAYKAVMKPTEGTILTVARESAEKAMEVAQSVHNMDQFLQLVIQEANESLIRTPDLLKVLKDAGVVDSGGKGLVSILEGAYNGLTGKEIVPVETASIIQTIDELHQNASLEYGYCTEFIIHGSDNQLEQYRDKIEIYGDSMLVVGNDEVIKVHIHTNHPGKVMEEALKVGYLSDIKIDNMRLQHRHKVFHEKSETGFKADPSEETQSYGMITVAMGEGISKIFQDFTVDVVIEGGQTMNPSTEDFMNAIDKINAHHIFIMPNNGNIIMAANQAKALSTKAITVIPTKTVPQGISAVLAFNPEAAVEDNETAMNQAIGVVRTGQVTFAVRDTEMNGLAIQKGAMIGLADKEILAAGKDVTQVSLDLVGKMVREGDEILTVYYGEEISEFMAIDLEEKLTEIYPDLEVEVYYGGQPLYYYIFSLE
ncbi:MAG: DAK2 domain-containing protein [Bacillota bacterium]|nr:DAK2 domain-containing protein [Bacillota bacterium]MDW7676095.1 DAK2 domain-containing protein [Bacillota bacterium]